MSMKETIHEFKGSKKEVTEFIYKYMRGDISIDEDTTPAEWANMEKIFTNIQSSESPDGYAIIDGKYYIAEHFCYDASKVSSRHGSQLMKKMIPDNNNLPKSNYEHTEIDTDSSVTYLFDNLINNFENHARKFESYKQNIKFQGLNYGGCFFFIEDNTIFGEINTDTERVFDIISTKDFIDVWKKYPYIDYIVLGGNCCGTNYCRIFSSRHCDNEYPTLESLKDKVLIMNRAQIIKTKNEIRWEKMSGESMNLLNENIEKLKAIFPEIVTDGKIDFDMLKTLLGEEVDASNEKYSFNWVGKRNCIKFAQTPSTGTLIPCREKSVDFDNTQNIYIEGDNVEALKLLQKTYFGKIKMIYIDPPYNTGNDFVYHDDYKDSIENYKKITGQQATANPETNGRFHTDWPNMMYPRLKLAKDLLSDDGVIFISIDDNEVDNLKRICDEIFGDDNFFANIAWRRQDGQTNIGNIARVKEYILIYSKTQNVKFGRLPLSDKAKKDYQYKDDNGFYGRGRLREPVRGRYNYDIVSPSGIVCKGPWLIPESEFNALVENNLVHWPEKEGGSPRKKIYLSEMIDKGQISNDFWGIEYGTNQRASIEVENLFGQRYFDFPKPVSLISTIIRLGSLQDSTILDFFSGSATTAHAVMQLNAEDGGNRKFIMVQLPELCDEKSEAYKAGYKTICDIGEERIRRAGAKIKEENPLTTLNLDTGFKVFRLDSTNIVPWNNAEKLDEMRLYDYAKTIKDGRDDLSVAYEIMLKYGVFDKPMKETVVSGKKMYDVGEGYMIICLADGVTMTDVEAIARLNPHCVVFKESGFADDNEKINATHTLERGGVEKILCI